MEKRQLNFDQPLLSVRRGSSMAVQPEVNKRKNHNSKPTLPPLPYYKSDLKSGPIRDAGAVPFQWEQMPGRPKDENKVPGDISEQQPSAPKLPPGRIVLLEKKTIDKVLKESPHSGCRSQPGSQMPSAFDISPGVKSTSEFDGTEKRAEDQDTSSSDDENVTYVDARDTLSRTESVYNCSVSGVSGLDDANTTSSAAFSDPQTRDFMMGRFLPAAKAVASETPPFVPRKHSSSREKPKPVKDLIKWKKQSPQYYILSHNIHGEGQGEEVDDEHDDEDEYDGTQDMSAKLCGLLPRFCMLNPIPGMRDHTPAVSMTRSVRTRPAYVGPSPQREKKDLTVGHGRVPKRVLYQHGSTANSSVHSNVGSKSVVPPKDGLPLPFLYSERRFLDSPLECRDLNASKLDLQKHGGLRLKVLEHSYAQEATSFPNPHMEKTLYVDSEQMEQSRNSNSSSSDSRGRNPSVDYSLQDTRSLASDTEKTSESKGSDTVDSMVVTASEKSFQYAGEDLVKDFQKHQDFSLVPDVEPQPKADVQNSNQKSSPPLAPLLPKSPSESWLSRTLPSMPSKNAYPKSYLGNLAFRASPMDPRDRLLRTSYRQHALLGPAGELAPILEN